MARPFIQIFSQKSRTCSRVFTSFITYLQILRISCQFSKFCWRYLHKISWSFPFLSSPSTFLTARWLPTPRSPFYGQFSQHLLDFPTEPCTGFDLLTGFYIPSGTNDCGDPGSQAHLGSQRWREFPSNHTVARSGRDCGESGGSGNCGGR